MKTIEFVFIGSQQVIVFLYITYIFICLASKLVGFG